jgi:hypothetical protein
MALFHSPYGSFCKPNHPRRLIIYYDGETLSGGGFMTNQIDRGTTYRAEFTFKKKVSPTQWFMEECAEIPKAWRREHTSFFSGGRIFNMSCVTSTLPNTTSVEVNFSLDHPIAINISRWAEVNCANLHYSSVAGLEMALQWFLGQVGWKGDRDLRFLLGYDGSQWFLAGANSAGLCAFHQVGHPFELSDNVNGFYVTLNPETFSQISWFSPGRENEAMDAVTSLRDNYFPEMQIDDKPFTDISVIASGNASSDVMKQLSTFLPRRVTHG